MTKMSDNAFPSILITEGTEPSAPAAGKQRLYIDSTTHTLHRTNSSGTEVDIEAAGGSGDVATDPIWAAAGDLVQGTGADTAAVLSLGSAGQGLVSTGSAVAWAEMLQWHVPVLTTIWTPDATTGTWALASGFSDSAQKYPFYVPGSTANSGGAAGLTNSSAAQNDAVAWDVVLAKGTWDANISVRKSTNTGIITLNQDGASQGTVDTYAASAAAAVVSVTGWTVATTGKKRMQLLMATKNASSSGYVLGVMAIEFRRTA